MGSSGDLKLIQQKWVVAENQDFYSAVLIVSRIDLILHHPICIVVLETHNDCEGIGIHKLCEFRGALKIKK